MVGRACCRRSTARCSGCCRPRTSPRARLWPRSRTAGSIFAPMVKPPEHLARIGQAEMALDCSPYGSHTTASDTLWAGVPLVALVGDTFASRVSASLLTAAGSPELITPSLAGYYNFALR